VFINSNLVFKKHHRVFLLYSLRIVASIAGRLTNERRAMRRILKGVNMSKLLLAATAALLLAGPTLSVAAEPVPTRALSTRGVDFNNTAQVKHFYAKLWHAAYQVCDSGSANPRFAQVDRSCVEQALVQAAQKINAPVLTAMIDRTVVGDPTVYSAGAR
jgi:UrcA family protein